MKATFFVIGKEGYNDQYRRIVEEGHTLGMHSYSHVYRDIYESVEAYGQDLEKLHTYLYELTGVDSRIRETAREAAVIRSARIRYRISLLIWDNRA